MSEVYEAEHIRLGSRHALKLFAYTGSDPDVRGRFIAEGELLLRIRHPRIARVTDTGTDSVSGNPYFVMDLITDPEGKITPLSEVAPGSVEEPVIGTWHDDIRDGLAHIHSMDVIHRDLKLENVLTGPDGHAVLTDFGISKITSRTDSAEVIKTVVRLRDGSVPVMGSMGYLAPEIEMGLPASRESDYYALGVMIFRLLTGTWCDHRTDISGLLEGYDPAWSEILPKLLHSNPRGRECLSWSGTRERDREKRLCDAEEEIENLNGSLKKRKKLLWALSAVLVCLSASATWLFARMDRIDPPAFEDLFYVPDDAPTDPETARKEGGSTREELSRTVPDAWMVTRGIFSEMRSGGISEKKAMLALDRLAYRAHRNDKSLFTPWPEYKVNGNNRALTELLNNAVSEMLEWGKTRKKR